MTEIGLTSGCFDLFHSGHLVYLQRCRSLCDRLIVGIDSDEMVRKSKGPKRPIIQENERLDLVNNLGIVSDVFILNELEDLNRAARKFGVTKLFKHQTILKLDKIYGLEGNNTRLVMVPDVPGLVSTSQIIERIIQRFCPPGG